MNELMGGLVKWAHPHMEKMFIKCHSYEFTLIAYKDPLWKEETTVPQIHARAMLTALSHYKMHTSDDMRFLGGYA